MIQRQHLGDEQAADDREAERAARLGTGAVAHRDRQRADQRRHRRHHDRPEAHQARFADRLGRRHPLLPLRRHGEVDHHDAVLLDQPDQHDDADEGVEVQLGAEHHQRQQRAEAGRGQPRQNGQRLGEAFVEDAQHDVDHHDGHQQDDAEALERVLEHLGGALEAASRSSPAALRRPPPAPARSRRRAPRRA